MVDELLKDKGIAEVCLISDGHIFKKSLSDS